MRRGAACGKEEETVDLGDSLENRSSRMPIRSQSSDMGDVVGLVKDMAKFLDRLQHENLSDDSEQVGVEALQQNNETILHISGTELNVFTHRVRSPFLPNKSPQLSGQPGLASRCIRFADVDGESAEQQRPVGRSVAADDQCRAGVDGQRGRLHPTGRGLPGSGSRPVSRIGRV